MPTNPLTYKIEDLAGEPIEGEYYQSELQRIPASVLDQPKRIEKIIRTKGNKQFVKWLGYPDKFNSWVNKEDIKDI